MPVPIPAPAPVAPPAPVSLSPMPPLVIGEESQARAPRPLPVTSKRAVKGDSAKGASDAAAERERAKEGAAAKGRATQEAGPLRRRTVDLLTFEPSLIHRLRLQKPFSTLLGSAAFQRKSKVVTDHHEEDRERRDLLRVLSFDQPLDLPQARRAAEAAQDSDDLELPLVLLAGEARAAFDELELLKTTLTVLQPLAPADKRAQAAVLSVQEAMAANPQPPPEKCTTLTKQLEQSSAGLSLPPKYLSTQVERTLLEGRMFKRRKLWGKLRFKLELTVGSELIPCYLEDEASDHWPILPSVAILVIGELRPREDMTESAAEAIWARAVGRLISSREAPQNRLG